MTRIEQVRIVIETGNAAFDDAPATEIAAILRRMADRIEETGLLPVPRDSNGNKCGHVHHEHA